MNQITKNSTLSTMLSLLATPWLLFVSTASALYLKNQTDLYNRYEVLYQFLVAAFIVFGIGVIVVLLAKKYKGFNSLLWAYYLLAPGYMIFQSGAAYFTESTPLIIWAVVLGVVFLGLIVLFNKKVDTARIAPLFVMIGSAFIAIDSYNFFANNQSPQSIYPQMEEKKDPRVSDEKKPNIYHLILDEYQVDMFTPTLNLDTKEKLSGFTLFDNATAIFGRTEMSLASIFSGQRYDFESAPAAYQQAAFSSENSLLSSLKKHGYQTYALMFPVYGFKLDNFDGIAFHKKARGFDYSFVDATFRRLWVFSVLPTPIISQFLNPVDLDQLKHRNLLPVSAPIESYLSMVNLIDQEKYLPGNNRYQLIHLLLPHFPYVLGADCSYTTDHKSSPLEQSHCATKLIIDFVDSLQALDRFDSSIIIVQSDHGARFELVDGKLRGLRENDTVRFGPVWSRARSRTLLMIKPAGVAAADVAFKRSAARVSLLDVAPSIIQSLGLSSEQAFDGSNIIDPQFAESDQPRYYYFYNKKDARGQHLTRMTRFRIEDTELVDEGLVKSGVFN